VWFFTQTYDGSGRLSPLIGLPVLVSDYVDDDQDGLPDDWEAAYEVSDPSLDEDGDGLTNEAEFFHRTHPRYADTDNDGFSDGTEIAGLTEPPDPNSMPPQLDPNATPATYENFTSGLLPCQIRASAGKTHFHAYTDGLCS
jgi:hypothetical protein